MTEELKEQMEEKRRGGVKEQRAGLPGVRAENMEKYYGRMKK